MSVGVSVVLCVCVYVCLCPPVWWAVAQKRVEDIPAGVSDAEAETWSIHSRSSWGPKSKT